MLSALEVTGQLLRVAKTIVGSAMLPDGETSLLLLVVTITPLA